MYSTYTVSDTLNMCTIMSHIHYIYVVHVYIQNVHVYIYVLYNLLCITYAMLWVCIPSPFFSLPLPPFSLVHVHHETTQCFIKQSRDFCVLANERKEVSASGSHDVMCMSCDPCSTECVSCDPFSIACDVM